jgi:HK97 family phage prohead protease
VTSVHVRRLESRIARTAARFAEHAARTGCTVDGLRDARLPWYEIRSASDAAEAAGTPDGPDTPTILIYEEIGGSFGVSAAEFARDLEEIDAPEILVRINSPGGSLFDGIAIYNALNTHPARIVVQVDSLAASIASVIAMAGDEVVMMPGSQMMIHDAGMVQDGNAEDMAKAATFLDRQSANVADIYRLRAGGDVQDWRDRMLAESWLFAAEAVELGLADRVVDPPARQEPTEVVEAMTRSFDLSGFRYAGRQAAPAPSRTRRTHRTPRPERVQRRARGAATVARPTVSASAASAGAARRAAYTADGKAERRPAPAGAPCGQARMLPFAAEMRSPAELVEKNGRMMRQVVGYATVFGEWYEMYDDFGPYRERVHQDAATATLAAKPDVAYLTNHKGITMARTTNSTLELSADQRGMPVVAYLNPERQDVRDLLSAIDDKLITEMSFAFLLEEGVWNEDFTEFTIMRFNIDRGDVSAVNYGANPYTSVTARSRELITHDLDRLPTGAARAALARLQQRADLSVGAPASPAEMASLLTQAMAWFTSIVWIVDEAQEALSEALGVPNPDTDDGEADEPGSEPAATNAAFAAGGLVGFGPDETPADAGRPEPQHPAPVAPSFDGRDLDAVAAWLATAEGRKTDN